MRRYILFTTCLLCLCGPAALADSMSFTGTLVTPEDVFTTSFTLTSPETVTVQTWGFGGGVNAAGRSIPAGGFDPLIALFHGSSPTGTIVTDGSGNPLADADNLFNPPWSFVGNCPPAGTVSIGSASDCGDDLLTSPLAAGTYTLLLSDANNIPAAVYDNGSLSEGFVDLSNGVFQTCDPDANACISPNGNYAVDLSYAATTPPGLTPEPSTLVMLESGLATLAAVVRLRNARRTRVPKTNGNRRIV